MGGITYPYRYIDYFLLFFIIKQVTDVNNSRQ